jgi:hypothetical protein
MNDIANYSSFGARAIAGTSPLLTHPVKQHKRR